MMPAMNGPQPGHKRCPDCAEDVREEARRCRFCGYSFEPRRPAGALLDFVRASKTPLSAEQLLASWGTELEAGEALERMVYCRLDETDGFLVVTVRRAMFFSARKPRCLLQVQREAISGSVRRGRLGGSRIELIAGGRTVVLSRFVSRDELARVAASLGVATT
jgi:hypothetical protein